MEKNKRKKIKVYKSLTGLRAQLIDDGGRVLLGRYFKFSHQGMPVEQSFAFGEEFGKAALQIKEKMVIYDRSKSRYHGQVKSFAEGLRKAGLNF